MKKLIVLLLILISAPLFSQYVTDFTKDGCQLISVDSDSSMQKIVLKYEGIMYTIKAPLDPNGVHINYIPAPLKKVFYTNTESNETNLKKLIVICSFTLIMFGLFGYFIFRI